MNTSNRLTISIVVWFVVLAGWSGTAVGAGAGYKGITHAGGIEISEENILTDAVLEFANESITVTETIDQDGDGQYSSFALEVQADTRLLNTDSGDDAGEPYYRIEINGEQVKETEQVEQGPSTTTTIQIDPALLQKFESGELDVSVALMDEDLAFDDEIRTWSIQVPYGPESSTEQSSDTSSNNQSSTQESATKTPSGPSDGEEWNVTVTRVIDGDTVEARFPNGEVDTLRLLGIDTPETTLSKVSPDKFEGIPNNTAGQDHLLNWGEKATNATNSTLNNETVQIEVDSQADRRGSYGRLLVYVNQSDKNFNKQLLSEGYARMYESSFSKQGEFEAAESNAQENNVGLWNYTEEQPSTVTSPEEKSTEGTAEQPSTPETPEEERSEDSTEQPSTSETPAEDSTDGLPPLPRDGDYDCGHFDSQSQAQTVLEREAGDPHRLDSDSDGIACESLP